MCFVTVEAAGQIVAGAVIYPRCSSAKPSAGQGGAGQAPAGPAQVACSGSKTQPPARFPTAAQQCCCHSAHAGAEDGGSSAQLRAVPDAGDASSAPGSSAPNFSAEAVCSPEGCSLDPHIYVELIVTKQPGCGWGSLLLAAIEAHAARQLGCRSVKLLSVHGAQDFYSKRGYSPPDAQQEMHKQLPLVLLPAQ